MKVSAFHLMPHRELPHDFEQRYESVWVTPPWWELADARRVGQYYNWTLDELLHAARAGFDGICTNEHHQNAYGFMPSPNLMGSVLAKQTNDLDVAIVQMGMTLPTTSPPIRIAEEYAMLDCISGGRLVAGLPLGSPMDVNLAYGITPMEHRERYREAVELVTKAWQAKEIFAWNGKYFQLGTVNLWPRPIQQPHPPIWIPGSGSISTFDFAADQNACYCFLSYSGARSAKAMMDGYWRVVEEQGARAQPVPRGVPAARGRLRDGCAGGGRLRAPRRVLLSQVPARAAAVGRAPGQPGLSQPAGRQPQPGAARGGSQDAALQGLRGQGLRHRGEPGHRARAPRRGSDQGPARRQPDGAGADRLDAARADAQEHRPASRRRSCPICATSGTRRAGRTTGGPSGCAGRASPSPWARRR